MKLALYLSLLSLALACQPTSNRKDNGNSNNGNGNNGNGDIQAIGSSDEIFSQVHRLRGTQPLTVQGEAEAIANNGVLPSGQLEIPMVEQSDDGINSTSVVVAPRPLVSCGLGTTFKSLRQRLLDCKTLNPNTYQWRGAVNGNSGEGTWQLVARHDSGKEVWMDAITGNVWSDVISTSANWCAASGNDESPTAGVSAIDCLTEGAGAQLCVSSALNSAMGQIPVAEISWRLPTRSDFLLADVNGARFVLPAANQKFWTATVSSESRDQAWQVQLKKGELSKADRDSAAAVRCLGRVVVP